MKKVKAMIENNRGLIKMWVLIIGAVLCIKLYRYAVDIAGI